MRIAVVSPLATAWTLNSTPRSLISAMSSATRPTNLWISADPDDYLLVGYGRMPLDQALLRSGLNSRLEIEHICDTHRGSRARAVTSARRAWSQKFSPQSTMCLVILRPLSSNETPARGSTGGSHNAPPSWHRLGPLHVPLEAKLCGHRAVAIPIVAVGGLIAVGPRQQRAQPQQPDVAYHQTLVGWRGR